MDRIVETPYICERHMGVATATPGDRTKGVKFNLLGPCRLPGADVYTPIVGSHELKLSLWRPVTGVLTHTLARSKTVIVPGPGKYRILFDEFLDVTWEILCGGISVAHPDNTAFYIGIYETSGTQYITSTNPAVNGYPSQCELILCGQSEFFYGHGDSIPASATSDAVPLSPLVHVEDSVFLPVTATKYCGPLNPNFGVLSFETPVTVGYSLRIVQPVRIRGFQFATAITEPHDVTIRFGVCVGYYNGKMLIEHVVSCPGAGEYTELLSTPFDYAMPDIVDDLQEKPEPPYEYRFYKGQYVSIFTEGNRTSGVPVSPLNLDTRIHNASYREVITEFGCRARWEEALWLGTGDPSAGVYVPLSLLVERIGR